MKRYSMSLKFKAVMHPRKDKADRYVEPDPEPIDLNGPLNGYDAGLLLSEAMDWKAKELVAQWIANRVAAKGVR